MTGRLSIHDMMTGNLIVCYGSQVISKLDKYIANFKIQDLDKAVLRQTMIMQVDSAK